MVQFAEKIPKHAPHFCNFSVDFFILDIFAHFVAKVHKNVIFLNKNPNNSETGALSLLISFFLHTETA